MSAIGLRCDICDVEIGDDPHWPHDAHCTGVIDPECVCAALTCSGCCPECFPIRGGADDREASGRSAGVTTSAPSVGVPTRGRSAPVSDSFDHDVRSVGSHSVPVEEAPALSPQPGA